MAQPATLPKTGRTSSRPRNPSGQSVLSRAYAEGRSSQDALERPQVTHPYAHPQVITPGLPTRSPPPPPVQQAYDYPPNPPSNLQAPHVATAPLKLRPRMSSAPATQTQGPLSSTTLDSSTDGTRIKPRVSSRPRAPGSKPPVVFVGKEGRPSVDMASMRRPSLDAAGVLNHRSYPAPGLQSHSNEFGQPPHSKGRQQPTMVPLKEMPSDRPSMNGRAMSAPPADAPSSPPRHNHFPAGSSATAQKKWKKSQQGALGVGHGPSRSTGAPSKSFDMDRQVSGTQSLDVARTFDGGLSGDEEERRTLGSKTNMKKKSTAALRALFGRGASGKSKKMEEAPPLPGNRYESRAVSEPPQRDWEQPSAGRSGRTTPTPRLYDERTNSTFSRDDRSKTPTLQSNSSPASSRSKAPARELPVPPQPSPSPSPNSLTAPPTAPPASSPASLHVPRSTTPVFDPSTSPLLSLSIDESPLFASSSPKKRRPATADNKPRTPPRLPSAERLQLPQLDLDFGLEFDLYGLSPSSSSRKSSPRRERNSPLASPKGSPARSYSYKSPGRPSTSPGTLPRSWTSRERGSEGGSPLPLSSISSTSPAPPAQKRNDEVFGGPLAPVAEQATQPTSSPSPSAALFLPNVPSSDDITSTDSTHESSSPALPVTPRESTATLGDVAINASSSSIAASSSTLAPKSVPELPPKDKSPVAPTLALPKLLPPTLTLAPPVDITPSKPIIITPPPPKAKPAPRQRTLVLLNRSTPVIPDKHITISTLASKAEDIRVAFKYPEAGVSSSDRSASLRAELVPLIAEADRRAYDVKKEDDYEVLRSVFLRWINLLISELRFDRPVDERGAVLESLAALFESICLSEEALQLSEDHQSKFTQMMVRCMSFVMEKLGGRGVFQNILVFSGRFLAFAFFRVPHVAHQLLTVLSLPKGALMRFAGSIEKVDCLAEVQPKYPEHLRPLIFDNAMAYNSRLNTFTAEFETDEERETFLFPPGYWLRRWQSDDSELFPSFYRAYHRQLAHYLGPVVKYYEAQNIPVPVGILMRAPGYAHLSTVFAKKLYSYIANTVNAVTTCSTSSNFDATESALQAPNAKPPVLVTANRRLTETLLTFSEQRISIPAGKEVIDCEMSQLYMGMIDLWTKNLITKTSLNAPKGVFCLFDLLDGIIDPPYGFIPGVPTRLDTVVDVPFLINVLRIILTETEHAMTLVKAIAFIFSHWEVLTARPEDRKELCLDLLLQKELFERLLLFWSHSVRSYVLRLVVFRLGHLEVTNSKGAGWQIEVQTVKVLETRLEGIKRRYDELEPGAAEAEQLQDGVKRISHMSPREEIEEPSMPRSRSTITMVADEPAAESNEKGSQEKAERLLGLGVGTINAPRGEVEVDPVTGSNKFGKAAKWLKKNFKNKKKTKSVSLGVEGSPTVSSDGDSPGLEQGEFSEGPKAPVPPSTPPKSSRASDITVSTATESTATTSPSTPPNRKPKPPTIVTTPSGERAERRRSRGAFTFEFDLPAMSPRSDTFDPPPTPTSPRRNSQPPPPSPRKPQSPHMSKSFSKRSSLLPPSTANALEALIASEREKEKEKKKAEEKLRQEKGYDKRLHPYAIRMLGELEDAQKEYDEWWSDSGYGRLDGLPPRLTVAWPFHENED
ncbi:hypothetical protein IAR50_000673 [Cryptococcus sp. DSM 104548]